jgi:hypothetical protein
MMGSDRAPRTISGSELRHLLVLRTRLRESVVGLPRAAMRDVLMALERARRAAGAPEAIPEMTAGELLRELKWRLDTAGTVELEAAAAALERARRAVARARRAGHRHSGSGSRSGGS